MKRQIKRVSIPCEVIIDDDESLDAEVLVEFEWVPYRAATYNDPLEGGYGEIESCMLHVDSPFQFNADSDVTICISGAVPFKLKLPAGTDINGIELPVNDNDNCMEAIQERLWEYHTEREAAAREEWEQRRYDERGL